MRPDSVGSAEFLHAAADGDRGAATQLVLDIQAETGGEVRVGVVDSPQESGQGVHDPGGARTRARIAQLPAE